MSTTSKNYYSRRLFNEEHRRMSTKSKRTENTHTDTSQRGEESARMGDACGLLGLLSLGELGPKEAVGEGREGRCVRLRPRETRDGYDLQICVQGNIICNRKMSTLGSFDAFLRIRVSGLDTEPSKKTKSLVSGRQPVYKNQS